MRQPVSGLPLTRQPQLAKHVCEERQLHRTPFQIVLRPLTRCLALRLAVDDGTEVVRDATHETALPLDADDRRRPGHEHGEQVVGGTPRVVGARPVAQREQARQSLLEAVQEVGAHGRDEMHHILVLQRAREQAVEPAEFPTVRERFFELVRDEQEAISLAGLLAHNQVEPVIRLQEALDRLVVLLTGDTERLGDRLGEVACRVGTGTEDGHMPSERHARGRDARFLEPAAPHRRDQPRANERIIDGGTTGGVQTLRDGRIVFTRQSLSEPADLWVQEPSSGAIRQLTTHNRERLLRVDMGTVEDMTFKGAGGDPVQMFVVFPPGFDPEKKWPLLHLVHGGPHSSWRDSFHYRWNAVLFASRGYVVAAVNFHGSTGFGQKFAESIVGAHADKPFTDIMKATDHLVARGYIDENRMAAAGGSYGGYLVSWILGHTDRFAALVNHAGVYDLMSQFASDWTWGRPTNYGAAPWEDPARIDEWSPSRFAHRFDTPTLILHGEKDYRVPYTQGVNLHGVLTGKGVPSRLVIFPEENHWIRKPQAARIWWNEIFDWLDAYVGAGTRASSPVDP